MRELYLEGGEAIVMCQVQGRGNYLEVWDLILLWQRMIVPAFTEMRSRGNIGGL